MEVDDDDGEQSVVTPDADVTDDRANQITSISLGWARNRAASLPGFKRVQRSPRPSAMSSVKKSKAPAPQLSDQEVQQNYSQLQSELQSIAAKIGELEQEAEEHVLVLSTLNEALAEEPNRKCFRLIGGVLVERTVKDVVPALQTNRDGIRKVIANLAEQYKSKEEDFEKFKREYNIRPAGRI
ncbi:hypothetical protein EW146_g6612 [Bondarzewia mesenterica]|uniref:Prefoldin subunit 2 n=1 Tax=Bondarzewia mesenterica TaxID=1095465 RepID=A0A4S4LN23_9AGAM|nr:hypothetical protein EW146_g6612 [Bondarzewia mesenterica]